MNSSVCGAVSDKDASLDVGMNAESNQGPSDAASMLKTFIKENLRDQPLGTGSSDVGTAELEAVLRWRQVQSSAEGLSEPGTRGIPTPEPQPLTRSNVTVHDEIWRVDDPSADTAVGLPEAKSPSLSPPLKSAYLGSPSARRWGFGILPIESLSDAESDQSYSSQDTMILINSAKGQGHSRFPEPPPSGAEGGASSHLEGGLRQFSSTGAQRSSGLIREDATSGSHGNQDAVPRRVRFVEEVVAESPTGGAIQRNIFVDYSRFCNRGDEDDDDGYESTDNASSTSSSSTNTIPCTAQVQDQPSSELTSVSPVVAGPSMSDNSGSLKTNFGYVNCLRVPSFRRMNMELRKKVVCKNVPRAQNDTIEKKLRMLCIDSAVESPQNIGCDVSDGDTKDPVDRRDGEVGHSMPNIGDNLGSSPGDADRVREFPAYDAGGESSPTTDHVTRGVANINTTGTFPRATQRPLSDTTWGTNRSFDDLSRGSQVPYPAIVPEDVGRSRSMGNLTLSVSPDGRVPRQIPDQPTRPAPVLREGWPPLANSFALHVDDTRHSPQQTDNSAGITTSDTFSDAGYRREMAASKSLPNLDQNSASASFEYGNDVIFNANYSPPVIESGRPAPRDFTTRMSSEILQSNADLPRDYLHRDAQANYNVSMETYYVQQTANDLRDIDRYEEGSYYPHHNFISGRFSPHTLDNAEQSFMSEGEVYRDVPEHSVPSPDPPHSPDDPRGRRAPVNYTLDDTARDPMGLVEKVVRRRRELFPHGRACDPGQDRRDRHAPTREPGLDKELTSNLGQERDWHGYAGQERDWVRSPGQDVNRAREPGEERYRHGDPGHDRTRRGLVPAPLVTNPKRFSAPAGRLSRPGSHVRPSSGRPQPMKALPLTTGPNPDETFEATARKMLDSQRDKMKDDYSRYLQLYMKFQKHQLRNENVADNSGSAARRASFPDDALLGLPREHFAGGPPDARLAGRSSPLSDLGRSGSPRASRDQSPGGIRFVRSADIYRMLEERRQPPRVTRSQPTTPTRDLPLNLTPGSHGDASQPRNDGQGDTHYTQWPPGGVTYSPPGGVTYSSSGGGNHHVKNLGRSYSERFLGGVYSYTGRSQEYNKKDNTTAGCNMISGDEHTRSMRI